MASSALKTVNFENNSKAIKKPTSVESTTRIVEPARNLRSQVLVCNMLKSCSRFAAEKLAVSQAMGSARRRMKTHMANGVEKPLSAIPHTMR
jgi:hypothetical protein